MTKKTFDRLEELGIYYEYKKSPINQTEPTFLKFHYLDYSIRTHKDSSVNDVLEELITFIAKHEREKGIEEGKKQMANKIKDLLNIQYEN